MDWQDPEQVRAYHRHRYAVNREHIRARQREKAQQNREKHRARGKRYYQECRETILARQADHAEERNAKKRTDRLAHPEETRQRDRQNYLKNREKKLAQKAIYRESHKEQDKAWRKKNRKKLLAYNEKYREEHHEQIRARQLDNYHSNKLSIEKHRSKKAQLPDNFTKEQYFFMLQYWNYACAVCGREEGFEWTISMDHWIPISSEQCPGTVAWNIVPLCCGLKGCNNSKHKKDGIIWLKQNYSLYKSKKILRSIEAYFTIVSARWPTINLLTNPRDSA
jgi:hypothetical protein